MSERGDSPERHPQYQDAGDEVAYEPLPEDMQEAAGHAEPERRGRRWIWLALVVIVIAAGLLSLPYAMPYLRQVLPAGLGTATPASEGGPPAGSPTAPPAPATQAAAPDEMEALRLQVADLGRRIDAQDALAARIAALEQRPTGADPALALGQRLTEMENRLQELASSDPVGAVAERLAVLERRAAQPAAISPETASGLAELRGALAQQNQHIGAQAEQIATLQRTVEEIREDARRLALGLGVTELAGAARRSGSFAAELQTVRKLAGDGAQAESLLVLEQHAEGVPTLAALRQQLDQLASGIVRAASRPAGDATWWERTLERLGSLVTIRRTGPAAGDTADAVVARAEAALAEGRLADAAGEIGSLQGPAAEVAAPWLQAARGRLAVERSLAELQGRTLAGIGAGQNPQ